MGVLDELQNGLGSLTSEVAGILGNNPVATAIGAGVVGAGLGVAGSAIIGGISKKKTKRTHKKSKNKKKHKARKHRRQKYPHTAGKRKDTSHRRIRYTKNNQPYIILANGRARFISKKSARSSKKRKGGRY